MVYKTYLEKFNTIISGSKLNTGISPISTMVYGRDKVVSRALMYFDHSKVKCMYESGVMPNMDKMTHTLHITNSGSLDFTKLHPCGESVINDNKNIRAASFDIVFFLIPKVWDRGKGFNYKKNFYNRGFYSNTTMNNERLLSEQGSNWYQRKNHIFWNEEGVYSNKTLLNEYDKWLIGEESVIIGKQHFDIGNENISFDITDTFNKFILGEKENFGIGMAFNPMLEASYDKYENYVTWFTDKTTTFFEPYVETRYDDHISDDRANFILDKDNKLYLYCTIGDELKDLDANPKVTVKDSDDNIILDNVESKKFSKGVYYIDIKMSRNEYKADTMLFDVWSDILYQGTKLDDVELDFVLKNNSNYFVIGNSLNTSSTTFTPTISGINDKEQISRGDVRKIVITARPNYTVNTAELLDDIDIRLYVRDGMGEIDVISWDKVNKSFSENFYTIDTNILIPNRYYVDVRIKYGFNTIVHHDILTFDIVNNLSNKYA